MLGKFLAESGLRDRVVPATKFAFNASAGDPNAGGNGRKNIHRALEGSLRRLRTDYVDLYWLHAWDLLTPVEEVMATIDGLVRAGKVRYFGLSDTPAWYAARAQSIAWLRGREPVAALQLEDSLVERNIEREHVPAALHLGLTPWSPPAGGFLTGKYRRASGDVAGDGRRQAMKDPGNPAFYKFTERNWRILETLQGGARELGRSPAQVAGNWITRRPGVASTIIGVRDLPPLEDNLRALAFEIPPEPGRRLAEASRPELGFPYTFFNERMQQRIAGGVPVRREPAWFRD